MSRKSRSRHLSIALLLSLVLLAIPYAVALAGTYTLPDTGQTKCYDNAGEIPCPNPGEPFYGQDGNYQGPQLSYQTSADGLMVADLNTGLTWQQSDGGVGRDWGDAKAYCDNLSLGGYSDWQLPSRRELVTIVDYGRYDPAIDPVFSSGSYLYWSGSTYAGNPVAVWNVDFFHGYASYFVKSVTHYVRCVRAGPLQFGPFVDNGDGTVTDTSTGLAWQRADDGYGRNWQEALSYCEGHDLAGQTDWRLPNIRELQSIVDDSRYNPAIDPAFSAQSDSYWSGSTLAYLPDIAWSVYFANGYADSYFKSVTHYVRCVRGGPTGSSANLALPTSKNVYVVSTPVDPFVNTNPAKAMPIGIGPVAQGGNTLNIRIKTAAFSGAADVYFAIFSPQVFGTNDILLYTGSAFVTLSQAGLVPMVASTTGPLDQSLFGAIPVTGLPSGAYTLFFAVAPAGSSLETFYLWSVAFTVP